MHDTLGLSPYDGELKVMSFHFSKEATFMGTSPFQDNKMNASSSL